jgi:hypothetical protein
MAAVPSCGRTPTGSPAAGRFFEVSEHLGPFARLRDGSLRELPDGWRERDFDVLKRDFRALGLEVVGVVTLDGALRERWPARETRAARVLRLAGGVRRALAGGHAEDAAWNAVRLGRELLLLELDLTGWIKAAEVGDAIGRGGAKGGRGTRELDPKRASLRERVVAEARWRLEGGWRLGKSELARRLAKEHGVPFNTVRDLLKPLPDPSRPGSQESWRRSSCSPTLGWHRLGTSRWCRGATWVSIHF